MKFVRYHSRSLGGGHDAWRLGLAAETRRTCIHRLRQAILLKVHQETFQHQLDNREQSFSGQPSPTSWPRGLPPVPPVPRIGTCLQVPHQTFLDIGPTSDSFWTLVTHTLVPTPDRRDMAVLLACLESVYRAEYQQLAGEAITAIAAANNAHVRPDGTVADAEALSVAPALVMDLPPPELLPLGREGEAITEATNADLAESLPTAAADGDGGGQAGRSRGGRGTELRASDLDVEALLQLLRLTRRAGYQPLTVRDVRLADSLNTDYLSQLFIKGSPRRLDGALVQHYVDPSLPAEARPVLLLQRGYGRELQSGRLLLQKLDYVQTLIVGQAGSWVAGAASMLAALLVGVFEWGSGSGAGPSRLVDEFTGAVAVRAAADSESEAAVSAVAVAAGIQGSGGVGDGGDGVYSALSDWGLAPRTDVIPLATFNSHFPVRERPGRQPLFICKISLSDALGGGDWLRGGLRGLMDGLLREVQLQEPTFREVLVLYRPTHSRMAPTLERQQNQRLEAASWLPWQRTTNQQQQDPDDDGQQLSSSSGDSERAGKSGRGRRQRQVNRGLRSGWLRRLWTSWGSSGEEKEPPVRRPPIQIRIYRDIPLPTWKVVLPEKLLQFRPLDLLRVDLFALAGLVGLAAQARYDNFLLDVITVGSAAALLVRIVLGYQRMADRFRSVVNELLAEKALAGQEGAVEALAIAAAQQQLRQSALAYVLLLHHCRSTAMGHQQQQQQGKGPGQGQQQGRELEMAVQAPAVAAEGTATAVLSAPALATTAQLQELAEWALAHHSGVRVRFNACQALHELHRLGLVVRVPGEGEGSGYSGGGGCVYNVREGEAGVNGELEEVLSAFRVRGCAGEGGGGRSASGGFVAADSSLGRIGRGKSGDDDDVGGHFGCRVGDMNEGAEEQSASAGGGRATSGSRHDIVVADPRTALVPGDDSCTSASLEALGSRASLNLAGTASATAAPTCEPTLGNTAASVAIKMLGFEPATAATAVADSSSSRARSLGGTAAAVLKRLGGVASASAVVPIPEAASSDHEESGNICGGGGSGFCCCEDPSLGCDGSDGCRCADVWWAAMPLPDAVPVVEAHWSGLLWNRVEAILRRHDGL